MQNVIKRIKSINFAETKHNIGRFFIKNTAYFVAALLPAVVLFTAYALFEVYPFGPRSVLALDLNAQYVTYFDYMHDVLAGRENIFYNWSGSLSEGFAGLFSYYLASPFNLIIMLFPRAAITEGIMAMLMTKAAAVGFTSCIFFKKHRKYSDFTSALFSVMFALSGYFVAHTINPMWLDGLVALPLVLMGVERIINEKKYLLYTLSLLYIFLAQYYIGYMVGIFSALYFLFYIISREKFPKKRDYFIRAGIYGASSVSAILMSGIMIIPAYKALQLGKMTHNATADFTPRENFNIGDILIKLFPSTYDTERPDGLPMLYCGTLALIFAFVWFSARRVPMRRRISAGFLLGIMVLSMYIKPIDMLWHGGQVPVWMPFRYSFTIIFFLLTLAAEAFENIKTVRPRQIGAGFMLWLGVLIFLDYYGGGEHFNTNLIIVTPIISLGVMAACAAAYKKFPTRAAAKVVIFAVCAAELSISARSYFDAIHEDVYYSSRESYVDEIVPAREAADKVKEQDGSLYRMEKTFHRTVNDNMAVGLYGVSHSTSSYNIRALQLLRDLGFGSRDHYSRYDGATMFTDDLFGIKYVLSKREILTPYTERILVDEDLCTKVFKNSDSPGVAFLANESVIGSIIAASSPFLFQERLAGMLSGRTEELYHPLYDYYEDSVNVNIGTTTDGHTSYKRRTAGVDATVSYTVTANRDGPVYVYFPSNYERICNFYIDGEYIKNYFESENHTIVYCGTYSAGESFIVMLKLVKDDMYTREPLFYTLDTEALREWNETVRADKCEVTEFSGNALTISVNSSASRALFTSIPLEDGWTATIDGKPADIYGAVNDTLLCLQVPPGEHVIKLSFIPSGFKTGLILTIIGAAMLAIMLCAPRVIKKKKAQELPPEDEASYEEFEEENE